MWWMSMVRTTELTMKMQKRIFPTPWEGGGIGKAFFIYKKLWLSRLSSKSNKSGPIFFFFWDTTDSSYFHYHPSPGAQSTLLFAGPRSECRWISFQRLPQQCPHLYSRVSKSLFTSVSFCGTDNTEGESEVYATSKVINCHRTARIGIPHWINVFSTSSTGMGYFDRFAYLQRRGVNEVSYSQITLSQARTIGNGHKMALPSVSAQSEIFGTEEAGVAAKSCHQILPERLPQSQIMNPSEDSGSWK